MAAYVWVGACALNACTLFMKLTPSFPSFAAGGPLQQMAHTHMWYTLTHTLVSTAHCHCQRSKYSRCRKLLGILKIVIIKAAIFCKSIGTAWIIFYSASIPAVEAPKKPDHVATWLQHTN